MAETPPDPFHLNPGLKERIGDPLCSYFRTFSVEEIDQKVRAAGIEDGWRRTDVDREATRVATLDGHDGALWIFAYGSLMWDPSMLFDEVRTAHAPDHARHFCLHDAAGRGSKEQPGLMAALDVAEDDEAGCNGLVFRIPQADLDAETRILWKREMITFGYRPEFIEVETSLGTERALTFLADHDSESVLTGLTLEQQAQMISRAEGILGTNAEYLDNVAAHLTSMGIVDQRLSMLHTRVRELRQDAWTA